MKKFLNLSCFLFIAQNAKGCCGFRSFIGWVEKNVKDYRIELFARLLKNFVGLFSILTEILYL